MQITFKKLLSISTMQAMLPVVLGFSLLFSQKYYQLLSMAWTQGIQTQAPLVLIVVIFLFWNSRQSLQAGTDQPAVLSGWLMFVFASCFYIIGNTLDILFFSLLSSIFFLCAFILIYRGYSLLKKLWFPLFFMVFMLPFPGFVIDAITVPMKILVSTAADNILYFFRYPIARDGVILHMGQYQLFVADACAGLHTLVSLEAVGLLYINLVKHDSFKRNLILALLIIPISFTANTIRVIFISLITYYCGDAVGQGFVHGFSGIFLFMVALSLIISIDTALQSFTQKKSLS